MQPDWILIANASRARVLQQEDGHRATIVQSMQHPASRLHSSELGDDERGRQGADRAFGGAAYEGHMEPQRKEHERFARELADFLEEGAQHGRCQHVRIFAASPFLGEVKAHLGSATRRLLAGCHDVDLTTVGPAEIDARIREALEKQHS